MAIEVQYLDTSFPDEWLDTKTPEEIKAWLEEYSRERGHEEAAWVCPLMDGHVSFGAEPDWRALHAN